MRVLNCWGSHAFSTADAVPKRPLLNRTQVAECKVVVDEWVSLVGRPHNFAPYPTELQFLAARIQKAAAALNRNIGNIEMAIHVKETLTIVNEAHQLYTNTIRDYSPAGFDARLFRKTSAIHTKMTNLEDLVMLAQANLKMLQDDVEKASKTAKKTLRCRRRKIFGILKDVFSYAACALALAAVITIFTGVGVVVAPVLGAGATLASAAVVICTTLQGPALEEDFSDVLSTMHTTIQKQSGVVKETLNGLQHASQMWSPSGAAPSPWLETSIPDQNSVQSNIFLFPDVAGSQLDSRSHEPTGDSILQSGHSMPVPDLIVDMSPLGATPHHKDFMPGPDTRQPDTADSLQSDPYTATSPVCPNPWTHTEQTNLSGSPTSSVCTAQDPENYVIKTEGTQWKPGHHFGPSLDEHLNLGLGAEGTTNSLRSCSTDMDSPSHIGEVETEILNGRTAGTSITISLSVEGSATSPSLANTRNTSANTPTCTAQPPDASLESQVCVVSEEPEACTQATLRVVQNNLDEKSCADFQEDPPSMNTTSIIRTESEEEALQTRSQTLDSFTSSTSSDGIINAIDELTNDIAFHDLMQTVRSPDNEQGCIWEEPHGACSAGYVDGQDAACQYFVPLQDSDAHSKVTVVDAGDVLGTTRLEIQSYSNQKISNVPCHERENLSKPSGDERVVSILQVPTQEVEIMSSYARKASDNDFLAIPEWRLHMSSVCSLPQQDGNAGIDHSDCQPYHGCEAADVTYDSAADTTTSLDSDSTRSWKTEDNRTIESACTSFFGVTEPSQTDAEDPCVQQDSVLSPFEPILTAVESLDTCVDLEGDPLLDDIAFKILDGKADTTSVDECNVSDTGLEMEMSGTQTHTDGACHLDKAAYTLQEPSISIVSPGEIQPHRQHRHATSVRGTPNAAILKVSSSRLQPSRYGGVVTGPKIHRSNPLITGVSVRDHIKLWEDFSGGHSSSAKIIKSAVVG